MAAEDIFAADRSRLNAPAYNASEVSPHDTNDLAYVTRGIYVGVSGDVTLVTASGDTITLVGLAAGLIHPIRAKIIKDTGTDAENIVALW
jgi:hypothetical protein